MNRRRDPVREQRRAERAEFLRATGDGRIADRMEAHDARKPKRLKPRRERHDTAATGERRKALALTQHGDDTGAYCASPWCGRRWRALSGELHARLHEAHVRNVGMGRSRHAQEAAVNLEENRVLLCSPCHARFGRVVLAARLELAAEWKAHFAFVPGHGARRGR